MALLRTAGVRFRSSFGAVRECLCRCIARLGVAEFLASLRSGKPGEALRVCHLPPVEPGRIAEMPPTGAIPAEPISIQPGASYD